VCSDPSAGAYGRRTEASAPGLRRLIRLLRRSRLAEVSPKTQKGPRLVGRGAPLTKCRRADSD